MSILSFTDQNSDTGSNCSSKDPLCVWVYVDVFLTFWPVLNVKFMFHSYTHVRLTNVMKYAIVWRSPNFMVILNPNRISSQYLFRFFPRCFESKITIKMILRKIKTLTLPAFMHAMHSKICRWTDGQPLFSECLYGCCKTLLHRLYVSSLPKLSKERPLLCLQTRRNVIELLNSTSKKPAIVFVHLRVSLVVKQCWN